MKRDNSTVVVVLIIACLYSAAAPPVQSEVTKPSVLCDASAAVPVGAAMFIVATNQDNRLRVYRRDSPGGPVPVYRRKKPSEPVPSVDLTSFLKLTETSRS